jgi:hypothetical protein
MTSLRDEIERKAKEAVDAGLDNAMVRKHDFSRIAPDGEEQGIELSEWVPVFSQAADLTTTLINVNKGYGVEANPVMRNLVTRPLLFVGLKGLLAFGMNRTVDRYNDEAGKLRRGGHEIEAQMMEKQARTWARRFMWVGLGPAIQNARVMIQARGK